jgi:hypothetical protein
VVICRTCDKEKSETEFYRNSKSCKKCKCIQTNQWRLANKDKVAATRKKHRLENIEKYRENDKLYRESNPDKINQSVKKYRENNRQKMRNATRKWQLVNHDKIQAWRDENRDKVISYSVKWKKNNPEKAIAMNRKSIKLQKKRYPEKTLARRITEKALRKRTIIRPMNCQICNKICKPEAHHADYSKPLELVWLCRQCHANLHKHLKRKTSL